MTEREIREDEEVQEEYRTAWIEAEYVVAGWAVDNKPNEELSED